jgi:predicted peptidase
MLMINRREFWFAFAAALSPKLISAQQRTLFLPKNYRNSRGDKLPYRFFSPQSYDNRKKYPLVLWLHGGAGRGTDNLKQISGGNTVGSHVWTSPKNQRKNPCFVVAPQCPGTKLWATLDTARPTEQLQLVLELLQDLGSTFSLDEQRLYVAGQSMGGFGTWSLISQYPGMFAAAIPICGGGNESEAAKLISTPIWAFHGEKDEAVSVERSRNMIAAVREAGGKAKYTEYKGAGHVIWDEVFSEPELIEWVFAQRNSQKQ